METTLQRPAFAAAMTTPKITTVVYWTVTALFCLQMSFTAYAQLTLPQVAEAFTRPKVMKYLAKSGFTQSYTYFTWRNVKWEITEYLTELTQTQVRDYMRPNFWPNTPDILPEYLQIGGPPAFHVRLVLAATLGASYGIYGPTFETFENAPVQPGKKLAPPTPPRSPHDTMKMKPAPAPQGEHSGHRMPRGR